MAIKKNQTVSMYYELSVDGKQMDSNFGSTPVEFKYGNGEVIPGLEKRMKDMNVGDTKTIEVPAIEAYGEHDEGQIETLPIEDFEGIDLEIGMVLEEVLEDDEPYRVTVIDVTKESVTVDYNHPLAGQDLVFKIKIEKIK